MQHPIQFNSNRYKYCDWSELLKVSYQYNGFPAMISNHGRLMIPEALITLSHVNVFTPFGIKKIEINDLEFIDNIFLNQCGIHVAKLSINVVNTFSESNGDPYLVICAEVCKNALILVKNILHYSHDHLKNREAEGIKLTQHESIKHAFANIICNLDLAETLLITADDISSIHTAFNCLLEALHRLAEINGGRAMLQGNAIELMFHINIFQSTFTSVRN